MNTVRLDTTTEIESVYRKQSPGMWRSLVLYTGSREVASDAVAEAFAQALAQIGRIRTPDRWVWKVAFRVANAQMRKRSRESGPMPDLLADISESFADLESALGKLSPRQRGAVVLHYVGGYGLRETAELLDSTTAAVGVHLHRARARLRQLLEVSDD
jgi:RNA polymerase sigma-70 factor, ECF subfamily